MNPPALITPCRAIRAATRLQRWHRVGRKRKPKQRPLPSRRGKKIPDRTGHAACLLCHPAGGRYGPGVIDRFTLPGSSKLVPLARLLLEQLGTAATAGYETDHSERSDLRCE